MHFVSHTNSYLKASFSVNLYGEESGRLSPRVKKDIQQSELHSAYKSKSMFANFIAVKYNHELIQR